MTSLITTLVCFVAPFAVLMMGLVWWSKQRRQARAEQPFDLATFSQFDRLVARWQTQGRISPQEAERVRALLAAEVALLTRQPEVAPAQGQQGMGEHAAPMTPDPALPSATGHPPAPAPAPLPAAMPTAPLLGETLLQPPLAAADVLPVAAVANESAGEVSPLPAPTPPLSSTPPPVAPSPPRTTRRSVRAALLALGTRRMLLFLGTFLLLMSSLTLIIFNWAVLPPLAQLTIIAGTTGLIWVAGAWMTTKPDLATAGQNLQLVAALLLPVVGFALSRPGLLELAPRQAWLLTAVISLTGYLVAAQRTGRAFYSGAAVVAAANLFPASLGQLALGWQLFPIMVLLTAVLPLAHRLAQSSVPRLGFGARMVALFGAPLCLALIALVDLGISGEPFALAASLAAGALFAEVAYRTEQREPWLWAAVLLPIAALRVTLMALNADLALNALGFGLAALVYLGLSIVGAQRLPPLRRPGLTGAVVLVLLTLPLALISLEATRLALPPLIIFGLAFVILAERGSFAWLGTQVPLLSTTSLASAGVLLFVWLGVVINDRLNDLSATSLYLLPLAALFFASARWWPGRLRQAYDYTMQGLALLVTLIAGQPTLMSDEHRLAAAVLLAVIFMGQALIRPHVAWAGVGLGIGSLAVAIAIDHLVSVVDQGPVVAVVALALAALLSLGGERLRLISFRHWTWPALGWASGWALVAAGTAWLEFWRYPGLTVGVWLALASLLGLHTYLWRQPRLGYPAALFLASAVLLAASESFFLAWQPAVEDLAYSIIALTVALALLGQFLRRFRPAYAWPYERVAFVVLPGAPLVAWFDAAHLSLAWIMLTLLYLVARWRYRLQWMLALAFLSLDLAALTTAAWQFPGGEPAGAGLMLAVIVVGQALFSAFIHHRLPTWGDAWRWGYLAAVPGAAGALALAATSPAYLAVVAGLFALLAGVLVWLERQPLLAWASLMLLAVSLEALHRFAGLSTDLSLLLGSFEALALFGVGWALHLRAAQRPVARLWDDALTIGAGGAMLLLPMTLAGQTWSTDGRFIGTAIFLTGLALGLLGGRLRQTKLAGPALAVWVAAVLAEGLVRVPIFWADAGSQVLLGLAWLIAAAALARRLSLAVRTRQALAEAKLFHGTIYGAALMSSVLALAGTIGNAGSTALISLGLALLTALIASLERREAVAWTSLGLGVVGAWFWFTTYTNSAEVWIAAWLILGMLGVSLASWGVRRLGLTVWQRPGVLGTLGVATLLALLVGLEANATGILPPLTLALVNLGLLLVTLAVRERELAYAYVAGASFVGAMLCQLADWGFRDAQWYVIPSGLYLLALAAGLRRFQGQRRVSQLIETVATILLLGVTFIDMIRNDGSLFTSILLFSESLVLAGYGALTRLRVPFVGGIGFFVIGVSWMTLENVRFANQWVLLGIVGLLMVVAYVILERHQERLVRTGRAWAVQLRSWN
ncbi:hypothetical protein [Candidatus Chloroploca sp. Khr17]|uniref:hypothetical protein n=1 Tax=Candidatus Chloroploca sp. Khr17 TaxID=2496869 RepID=UPI00101B646F|nr:hypothetical protein [Candidatus Chloroploca sp. Khr17]